MSIKYRIGLTHSDGRTDATKCAVAVCSHYPYGRHQCRRKRGLGPDGAYCWQHARMLEAITVQMDKQERTRSSEEERR